MIIYLGSIRSAKVEAARDALTAVAALDRRFEPAELRTVDMGGVGPRMPMGEPAIVAAAEGRVRAMMAAGPSTGAEDCLYIGLEGGVDPVTLPDGRSLLALKNWACVSDGRRWSYGAGGAILLPEHVASGLTDGTELGDVIDRTAGAGVRNTRGAWGVLTRDLVTRRDAFRTAVISALAPFFNADAFV